MKKLFALFVLTLPICLAAQLSGDYNIGGESPDYMTLQEAVNDLQVEGVSSNVNFIVRDGIYEESFAINEISGSGPDAWITFKSESADAAAVILNSQSPIDQSILWELNNISFIRFENISFHNSNIDPMLTNTSLGAVGESGNIEIIDCIFSSEQTNGTDIKLELSNEIRIEGNSFQLSDNAIELVGDNLTEVVISQNQFDQVIQPVQTVETNTLHIEGNIFNGIEDCKAIQIGANSNEVSILNNIFEGEFNQLISNMGTCLEFSIDHNQFIINGIDNTSINLEQISNFQMNNNSDEGTAHYSVFLGDAQDVTIIKNQLSKVEIYPMFGNLIFKNNYVQSEEELFASIDIYDLDIPSQGQALVTGNVFQGNGQNYPLAFYDFYMESDASFEISNNAFLNGLAAIQLSSIGSSEVNIHHNSIYGSAQMEAPANQLDILFIEQLNVHNNIFSCMDCISGNLISFINDFGIISTLDFDNNVYHINAANNEIDLLSIDYSFETYHTLSDLQTAGYDINSIEADPQFYDKESDLRICNESLNETVPLIEGISLDIFETERPAMTTPGFYEYVDLASDFTFIQDSALVNFEMIESPAMTSWEWNFGDGTTSTEVNPTHIFTESNTYTVTLTQHNVCGTDIVKTEVITVSLVSGFQNIFEFDTELYPNPTNGQLYLDSQEEISRVQVYTIEGKLVKDFKSFSNIPTIEIPTADLRNGSYLIHLTYANGHISSERFIKE